MIVLILSLVFDCWLDPRKFIQSLLDISRESLLAFEFINLVLEFLCDPNPNYYAFYHATLC